MENKKIGIIGSGIAGLTCAHTLMAAGFQVFILDKGRKPGGRMSTRIYANTKWDHGAQYFTIRDERFSLFINQFKKENIISKWFDRLPGESNLKRIRYAGFGGMYNLASEISKGINIKQSVEVVRINLNKNQGWEIIDKCGFKYKCDELVLTQPLPQVVDLIIRSKLCDLVKSFDLLESVNYKKGFACMLLLDAKTKIPKPGVISFNEGPVKWIADQSHKPGFSCKRSVVLHSSHDFAEEAFNLDDTTASSIMIDKIKSFINSPVREIYCHRWLYAFADNPLSLTHYSEYDINLSIAGDAFKSSRIESSSLSGMEAAKSIIYNSK